tara:strand:- start:663 stop:1016 length:354 start_codon:yes stop_codon:yes gene_type:complete
MAYFAELDKNNIVLRVVIIDDKHEQEGIEWCENFFNGGTWLQTSYTGSIRKNYAGIGHIYDPELDAFYIPQPYPSWKLDSNCQWQPPVSYPTLEKPGKQKAVWNESKINWVITDISE